MLPNVDTNFENGCWINPTYGYSTSVISYRYFFDPTEIPTSINGTKALLIENIGIKKNYIADTLTGDSTKPYQGVRGYAETKLNSPLVANVPYYFKCSFISARGTDYPYNFFCIENSFGVYLSVNKIPITNTTHRLNYNPQIVFSNFVFTKHDTLEIIECKATYIAQGGEKYLTVGNFEYHKDMKYCYTMPSLFDSNQHTIGYDGAGHGYFLDDLTLTADTTTPLISLDHFSLGNDTTLCTGQSITLGGEPYFYSYTWNTGDTTRFIPHTHLAPIGVGSIMVAVPLQILYKYIHQPHPCI